MATIIANGNASIMSRAMYDTEDGYFEHATPSGVSSASQRRANRKTLGIRSNTGFTGRVDKPDIYGPNTTWRDGVPYPDKNWARKGVQPVEHPYIKGRWVDPEDVDRIRNFYKNKTAAATRAGTKNAINSVTNAVGNEAGNIKGGWQSSTSAYDATHRQRTYKRDANGNMVVTGEKNTGNAFGRTVAGVKGAVGNSAAANAARNEAGNIKGGWDSATAAYDASHRQRTYKRDANGNMVYTGEKNTGNAFGRTAAGVKGAIGNSAVGRAGKAAFQAIMDKFDDFKKGIDKYLTGDNAKANRSQLMSDLNAKGGELISQIRNALGSLGTSGGRTKAFDKITGTIGGTVSGIARGIATSDIGKAAISAGQKVYGAVRDKVGGALDSIQRFFFQFRKRGTTSSTAHLNTRAASV